MNENVKLFNGDCLEVMDKLIVEGVKVDAVITDPPYGTTACKWDSVIDFDEMWKRLKRLRSDRTPIVLFGSEPFTSLLISSNVKEYKHQWFWNKKQSGSPQNAKYLPHQIIENIIVFGEGRVNYYPIMVKGKMRKRGGYKKSSSTMNDFNLGYENYSDEYYPTALIEYISKRNGRFHPTQKPVALMEYLIKTYTNEGDTVLDFTMGSGSTAIASINTNRKFIGIELDENYFNIASDRIHKALTEKENI